MDPVNIACAAAEPCSKKKAAATSDSHFVVRKEPSRIDINRECAAEMGSVSYADIASAAM